MPTPSSDVRAVVSIRLQHRDDPVEDVTGDRSRQPQIDPVQAATEGDLEEMLWGLRQLFTDISPYGTVFMPDGTVREWDETGLLPPVQ